MINRPRLVDMNHLDDRRMCNDVVNQDTDLGFSHTDDLARKKAGFKELLPFSTFLFYTENVFCQIFDSDFF